MRNQSEYVRWQNATHVMVDLETLGTRPDAPVLSIGAVALREGATAELHQELQLVGSLKPSKLQKFYTQRSLASFGPEEGIEGGTLAWWAGDGKERGDRLPRFNGPFGYSSRRTMLDAFLEWLPDNAWVWGNGVASDNGWLASMCRAENRAWPFRRDRCYRTLKHLFPDVPAPSWSGVEHHALSDAAWQMAHLIDLLEALPK